MFFLTGILEHFKDGTKIEHVFRQEFLAVLLDTIHEEMNSARKEPNVPTVPEITIPNDIIQESGSPDSAFLSAGSSTDNQV